MPIIAHEIEFQSFAQLLDNCRERPSLKDFWAYQYGTWRHTDKQQWVESTMNRFNRIINDENLKAMLGTTSKFSWQEALSEGFIVLCNFQYDLLTDLDTEIAGNLVVDALDTASVGRDERLPVYHVFIDEIGRFQPTKLTKFASQTRAGNVWLRLMFQNLAQLEGVQGSRKTIEDLLSHTDQLCVFKTKVDNRDLAGKLYGLTGTEEIYQEVRQWFNFLVPEPVFAPAEVEKDIHARKLQLPHRKYVFRDFRYQDQPDDPQTTLDLEQVPRMDETTEDGLEVIKAVMEMEAYSGNKFGFKKSDIWREIEQRHQEIRHILGRDDDSDGASKRSRPRPDKPTPHIGWKPIG